VPLNNRRQKCQVCEILEIEEEQNPPHHHKKGDQSYEYPKRKTEFEAS
tara:strand:- start:174 stop:317 length:144 start_codon:yes stop_codon:yes gene_type:complete